MIEAARQIMAELAVRPLQLVGVGWSTVELARAERELSAALGPALVAPFGPAPDDEIMGAYCRQARLEDGLAIVLLEPNTEGRLAGALVRWGEAVVVAYVSEAPGRHGSTSSGGGHGAHGGQGPVAPGPGLRGAMAAGPLGPARHLAGGRRGPHLILVELG